ncbi:MAG: class I SAM-dependent methyltransferase [Candidatus Hydrogenedentes bacterium]|nr:class I SAM-dependent methyltransferase [Candidatus Hydrogenedentota bacterium]
MREAEYETMYHVEDLHWWYRGLRALIRSSWETHAPRSDGKILDIGCGTGANLALFADEISAAGIDYSSAALERCQRRGLTQVARADAQALPFHSESFDGALMMDLLYHRDVSDTALALAEAARVLRPDGLLLVNVPAYQWLYSSHDRAIHTGRRFTRPELVALIESAGLEPLRATYWNAILFPAIALLRLLRRNSSRQASDLEGYGGNAIARILGGILALERTAMRLGNLPFGLSIFAVARRPAR